jgi:hypothetical protein
MLSPATPLFKTQLPETNESFEHESNFKNTKNSATSRSDGVLSALSTTELDSQTTIPNRNNKKKEKSNKASLKDPKKGKSTSKASTISSNDTDSVMANKPYTEKKDFIKRNIEVANVLNLRCQC